jgi:DNA-binding response OmpR family regulator
MSGDDPRATRAPIPETVLVVDTEVLVRMTISAFLRDCGYRVIEAANAEEALTVLRQAAVRIDAVLTDVALSGPMDGFGLARWVRERRKGVDVILAGTPARSAERAADLCEKGPELARPYEPQVVVDRIRRLLAERDKPGDGAAS